jgi:hypothetical protein
MATMLDLTQNKYSSQWRQNNGDEFWVMELGKYEYGPFDSEKEAEEALKSYQKILKSDIQTYMSGATDKEESKDSQSYYKKKADEVRKKLDSLKVKKL